MSRPTRPHPLSARTGPVPARTQPLRAAPPAEEEPGPARSRLRSVLVGLGIGSGAGVAGVAIAFSIVAVPLFVLASTEPGSGLDRTLIRRGLFQVALPFGVITGIAVGIAVGVWYARGGRLPRDRSPIHG